MIYLRTWEVSTFVGFPTAEICPYLESYCTREWGATRHHVWTHNGTTGPQHVYLFLESLPNGLFTTANVIM